MACIRKRRGRYVVDYYDGSGQRRVPSFKTRREAEQFLALALRASRQAVRPAVDPDIRLGEYADRYWLAAVAVTAKPATLKAYRGHLKRHILPWFGRAPIRLLQREAVRTFLHGLLALGLKRSTVGTIHSALRTLLSAAVEDGIVAGNIAAGLGRKLKLVPSAAAMQEQIKAFTREQLALLLHTAQDPAKARPHERRLYVLFLLLARAGLRLGEARALQWDDLDLQAREIRVLRTFSSETLGSPKSGHGRTVDMSRDLAAALTRLRTERRAETLRSGWPTVPPWVFVTSDGQPVAERLVRSIFRRLLQAAQLSGHFTLHSFRHSFASLLLQQGESPVYVQRQLGHASIKITVDTYGKWLRPEPTRGGVDALASPSGSALVAAGGGGGDNCLISRTNDVDLPLTSHYRLLIMKLDGL